MSNLVETRQREMVFEIVLNRPEKRNAISWELGQQLLDALDAAIQAEGVRVVLLRGAGPMFSAGIDLNDLAALPTRYGPSWARHMRAITDDWQRVTTRLERLELPTIALLHGAALGLAFEVALACDFRIAAHGTRLGLPETRLGIVPDVGGTTRLTRIVGPARAKELILTGRTVTAQDVADWGLLTQVVAADALDAAADTLVAELAQAAPLAVGMAKRVIDGMADVERGLLLEGWAQSQLIRTNDFMAGVQAAIERRAAEFKGE